MFPTLTRNFRVCFVAFESLVRFFPALGALTRLLRRLVVFFTLPPAPADGSVLSLESRLRFRALALSVPLSLRRPTLSLSPPKGKGSVLGSETLRTVLSLRLLVPSFSGSITQTQWLSPISVRREWSIAKTVASSADLFGLHGEL